MKLKRVFAFLLIFSFLFIIFATSVSAASEQDILNFLKQKVAVNGKTYKLSNDYLVRAERFLKTHKYSSAQYDQFLIRMKQVLDIMIKEGKTDLTAMTWQSEHIILRLIREGADIAGIVVVYKKSDKKGTLEFYEKNGRKIDSIPDASKVFKRTGAEDADPIYVMGIGLGGVALAFVGTGFLYFRRRTLKKQIN